MRNEQLCHQCKKWTTRAGLESDVCEHCGALLDEHRLKNREEKHKIKKQSEAESLFFIREEDSERKRKLKKAAVWGRLLFFILLFGTIIVIFLSHG